MGFSQEYFNSFQNDLLAYCRKFKVDGLTVTIRLAYGGEHDIAFITSHTDKLISFAYYDEQKGAASALPVLTVPYSGIACINVRPSKAPKGKKHLGFQLSSGDALK